MDYEIVHNIRYSPDKDLPAACEKCGTEFHDLDRCYQIKGR